MGSMSVAGIPGCLCRALHERGLIEPDQGGCIAKRGSLRWSWSAGANVACPSMQTTNDMAVTMVPSFETFGVCSIANQAPHYHP